MTSSWVKRSSCLRGRTIIYVHIEKNLLFVKKRWSIWISFVKSFNGPWSHQISSSDHYLASRQVIIPHGWRQISLARGKIIDSCAIQIRSSGGGSLLSPLAPLLHQSRMPSETFLVDGYKFRRRLSTFARKLGRNAKNVRRSVLTATINHVRARTARNSNMPSG